MSAHPGELLEEVMTTSLKHGDLTAHPLTSVFPSLADRDYESLKEDILRNGLREPIVTHEGAIVDGRERYRACCELGIEPEIREWNETGSVLDLIVSLNLRRRHLSESQRSLIAARLTELYAAEEGEARGRRKKSADLRSLPERGKRSVRAAAVMGVSARSVESARRVLRGGTPELVRAVERDEIAVSVAAEATKLPASMQEELVRQGDRALRNAIREHARAERLTRMEQSAARSLSNMGRRFAVLYADPPWSYEHVASNSRAVENHYPTLEFAELAALPVAEVAANDCILFMWATVPKLAQAIDLMRCWGFEYRSAYVWDKQVSGMGYWSRVCHENLLIGIRGNPPAPPISARRPSIIRSKRTAHSSKPESVRGIIDALVPGVPKLELFARGSLTVPGWEAWGNEVITQVMPASATNDTATARSGAVRAESNGRRDDNVERSTYSSARAHGQTNTQGRTPCERVRALS
jgi:N6-adenosine-specific RNA methylase IME4